MSTVPPPPTDPPEARPAPAPTRWPETMNGVASLISAGTALLGLVLGFFVLPAAGVPSPVAPNATTTVAVPGPVTTVTATATVTAAPQDAGRSSASASGGPSGAVLLRDVPVLPESFNPLSAHQATLDGKSQDDAVTAVSYANAGGVRTYYNLGRGYRKLTGLLGLDDSSRNMETDVSIEADGKRLQFVHLSLGRTTPIDVDVTGALRLAITCTAPRSSNGIEGPTVVFSGAALS
ncbi:NPCBM/NEW2 domain-containing protein [Kitasatospora cineracea]